MKHILGIAAIAASVAFASPAYAAVDICTGANCVNPDGIVNLVGGSNLSFVQGTVQNGSGAGQGITFRSSTDPLLNASADGQAMISSADGLLNGLSFTLNNGATFTTAIFNLFPVPGQGTNEATSVIFSFSDGTSATRSVDTNGQNFFGFQATGSTRLTGITFIGNPASTGIHDFRQLRLGGIQAPIPEPGTWAMMLLGFGAMGVSIRRSRRKYGYLLQAA